MWVCNSATLLVFNSWTSGPLGSDQGKLWMCRSWKHTEKMASCFGLRLYPKLEMHGNGIRLRDKAGFMGNRPYWHSMHIIFDHMVLLLHKCAQMKWDHISTEPTRLNLPVLTGNCLEEARQDFDNLVLERTVGNSGGFCCWDWWMVGFLCVFSLPKSKVKKSFFLKSDTFIWLVEKKNKTQQDVIPFQKTNIAYIAKNARKCFFPFFPTRKTCLQSILGGKYLMAFKS